MKQDDPKLDFLKEPLWPWPTPTYHAEKCPICYGKGHLFNDDPDSNSMTKSCHGCNGRGWVEVKNS